MLKRRRSSSFSYLPAKSFRSTRFASYRRPSRNTPAVHALPQIPLHPRDTPVYNMHQFHSTVSITQTASAETITAMTMVLSGLPNITPVAALFDEYRVNYMEFTFRPRITEWTSTTVSITAPRIYTAIDKDGSAGATVAQIQQYQTCQTHDSNDVFTIRFKPGVLMPAWTGAVSAPAIKRVSPWVDIAQTGIQHYGLITGITAGAAAQTQLQTWDVDLYLGLSFRCVR